MGVFRFQDDEAIIFDGQWIGFREACKKKTKRKTPHTFWERSWFPLDFTIFHLKKVSSYIFQHIFPSNHSLKWSSVRFGAKVLGFDKGSQTWRTEGALDDGIFHMYLDGSLMVHKFTFVIVYIDGPTTSIYTMNRYSNQI